MKEILHEDKTEINHEECSIDEGKVVKAISESIHEIINVDEVMND